MQLVPTSSNAALLFLLAAPALCMPGLGVNIHTTAPAPGEAALMRSAGFGTVRMDLHWHDTETAPGVYDFAPYDRLMTALEAERIRPLLILNYGHPGYDAGHAPASPAARQAFARWAAAAAARYSGRGVLWEIYNEPNLAHFWRPEPDAEAYVALVEATAAAIRAVAPGETIIGPASSGIDLAFLEECFRLGLLRHVDAVTVHPYRHHEPESAAGDYRRLRALIARYAPAGKELSVLCGEWGYSAAWAGYDSRKQALMLARMALTNAAARIPLTIWYDWRNDGPDASDPEHNFGLLGLDGRPKPAFQAAAALANELGGYDYHLRLETGRADEYVLLFKSAAGVKLAAWTTSPRPRRIGLPVSPGAFRAVDWLGTELPAIAAGEAGLELELTQEPVLLEPLGANPNLGLAGEWQALPHTLRVEAPAEVELSTNLASRGLQVLRNEGGCEVTLELPLAAGRVWRQAVWLEVANPLSLTVTPQLTQVAKPFGGALNGELQAGEVQTAVQLPEGEAVRSYSLPEGAVELREEMGRVLAAAPRRRFFAAGSLEGARPVSDGDPAVAAASIVTPGCPEGLGDADCASVEIQLGSGARFIRFVPPAGNPAIPEGAGALGAWIHGDGSGMILRLRFLGADGQAFQPAGMAVVWRGWRWVEIPIRGDEARLASWGGAADGQPRGPFQLDTLLLVDKPGPQPFEGRIAVSAMFWIGG